MQIKQQDEPQPGGSVGWTMCTPKGGGSIPGQGTHLGCWFDPQMGHVKEATNRCFSLSQSINIFF